MAEPTWVHDVDEPWDEWLRRRYVVALPEHAPENQSPRYLMLLYGNFRELPREELVQFVSALADDAREISNKDLNFLFHDLGWRERLTAAWLVAADVRTRFRHILRHLLLNEAGGHANLGYVFALTALEDAEGLVAYLDQRMFEGDGDGDPAEALGALVYLDKVGGTRHAQKFLGYGLEYQHFADFMEYTDRI